MKMVEMMEALMVDYLVDLMVAWLDWILVEY